MSSCWLSEEEVRRAEGNGTSRTKGPKVEVVCQICKMEIRTVWNGVKKKKREGKRYVMKLEK